jgi:hypothetical protein
MYTSHHAGEYIQPELEMEAGFAAAGLLSSGLCGRCWKSLPSGATSEKKLLDGVQLG